jgi:microsomal dipeptidase-like Zn-dependent dipeptidase/gamma-glutamyl-gamma-aminobutyrate hydrolase PuuD
MKAYYEHISSPPKHKSPCIGLSANFDDKQALLAKAYFEALTLAGGSPLIIPPFKGKEQVESLLDRLDAIIFTGGGDFDPALLGEEPHEALGSFNSVRDEFELRLLKLALDKQLPILGICRGIQLINLGMGGSLYQDIYSQRRKQCINHNQTGERSETSHYVELMPDTLLRSFFNKDELAVNSFHHQAIKELAGGLKVCALSSDGIIEAVESDQGKAILGLQWHPECLVSHSKEPMLPVFNWLVKEAGLYRNCRDLCQSNITLDSHCDTALYFTKEQHIEVELYSPGFDFYSGISANNANGEALSSIPENKVDLRKMQNGGLDCAVMAAYIKQGSRDRQGLEKAGQTCRNMLESIQKQVANYPHLAGLARTAEDIRKLKSQGKKAILLAIENAYALGTDLNLLKEFDKAGVCYITLCHNGHNDVCDSASDENNPEHHGLSPFGKELVKSMSAMGILPDVSHASEKTFYDVLEYCPAPVIASHSSAKALCKHPRNLSDDQILALGKHKGYIGICLYEGFLAKNRRAGIRDVIAHINHIRSLAGVEIIGIGSDFDGGGGIPGCQNAGELIHLLRALKAEGYRDEEIALITGGNFIRTLELAQLYAENPKNAP